MISQQTQVTQRPCVVAKSLLLLLLLLGFCRETEAARPWAMAWSDKSYGPDGPWHAVSVSVGSPAQKIALYPGGGWESKILLSSICTDTSLSTVCYAADAGLFDPGKSKTWDNKSISLAPDGRKWDRYQLGDTNAVPVNALARHARDSIDIGGTIVPQVDLVGILQAYQTYPGGRKYPLEVGVLSLGSPDVNRSFTRPGNSSIDANFITSWLWNGTGRQVTPSYSYGMHIGSVSLGIPGTLLLGGYDKNRVLGDVSAQPYTGASLPIELLDLGLGVATGGSPWSYPNKTGLLAQGNSSLSTGITVRGGTVDPYLYLPQSTCDALAAELPVTYKPDYGLYFWNTSDPRYPQIVTSPSYLAFTFSKNGLNTANMTVKVPFALLNLTLEAPLVDTPTAYFPCMGTNGTYALGRAFFQAAFIGVNWGSGLGNWFLAQAPGPGYSPTPSTTVIEYSDTTISGSANGWEESWAQHWTPIPASSSTPPAATGSDSSGSDAGGGGLSTGAKAGIGVGCAVAGLSLIALAWWFLARRRHDYQMTNLDTNGEQTATVASVAPVVPQPKPQEVFEMGENRLDQGPYELSGR